MPYKKVTELPPGVKDALPTAAQHIYMAAYNASFSSCKKKKGADCEGYAHQVAWSAVKTSYKKKDDKWVIKKKDK